MTSPPTARIGEHHAVAKPVVAATVCLGGRRAACAVCAVTRIAQSHEARFFQQRVVIGREHTRQRAPAGRCEAEVEARGNRANQSALLEVVHCARVFTQLAAVEVGRLLQHLAQRQAALAQRVAALALVGADLLFGHREASALGQITHRFDEAQAQVFGEEADGVAAGATAEAVIELLGRADRKAG